ncbi:GNAT family N-acetyltransferase [Pinibacter soli]|uniref:GNAT family N-acetyltransferase n=1 Tax=Pinibacter soli TaxID=3044211 RepID=A0ABT6RHQ0_9BACT|nr:GNAT family N-acetyltransferase [Pinibacter soli]MDI3322103.1 GNAT family N-acetyltransferase [Pinibacter soli]
MNENIEIRRIRPEDNKALAVIVRNALAEFGANKPGTVFFDPTTDNLFELFQQPGGVYFVALINNEVVGGAGIFPTEGLPSDTCELVKMYLSSAVRGRGLGKFLIDKCMAHAIEEGYSRMYLETLPELRKAVLVYEKFGFQYLDAPLGNSGHFGCDVWMIKQLKI